MQFQLFKRISQNFQKNFRQFVTTPWQRIVHWEYSEKKISLVQLGTWCKARNTLEHMHVTHHTRQCEHASVRQYGQSLKHAHTALACLMCASTRAINFQYIKVSTLQGTIRTSAVWMKLMYTKFTRCVLRHLTNTCWDKSSVARLPSVHHKELQLRA